MIGTHRKEAQLQGASKRASKEKEEEEERERKVIGDEKRHDQNYKMKKVEKKSFRYNNKRNITKDCMAYLV